MAATDAIPLPIKNRAYRLVMRVVNFTTGRPITGGLTGLSCTISKDGAAFAAIAGTIAEVGTTGLINIDLTAADMNADTIAVEPICTNANFYLPCPTINPAEPGDFPVNVVAQEGVDLAAGTGAIASLGITKQGALVSCTTTGCVLDAPSAFDNDALRGQQIEIFGTTPGYWQAARVLTNVLSGDAVTFEAPLTILPVGGLRYRLFGVAPQLPEPIALPESGEQVLRQSESSSTLRRALIQAIDNSTGLPSTSAGIVNADLKIIKVGAAGTPTEVVSTGNITQLVGTPNYIYEFTVGELDTVGQLGLRFSKAGFREHTLKFKIVGYNPSDVVNLGLLSLPHATANAAGGLSSAVNHNGTTQAGGTTTTVVLSASASSVDNFYLNQRFKPNGAFATFGGRIITGYVGATRTATLDRAYPSAIGAGETYQVEDAAGISTGGGGGLDAAATRAALGLSAPNLDTQLSNLAGSSTGIKAKTDQLTFSAGAVASNVVAMSADVVNATALASDAVAEIAAAVPGGGGGGGGTGDAMQSTLLAVKAKTDQLAFSGGAVVAQAAAVTAPVVTAIQGSVQATVDAVKAQTDKLTFDGTDVNANVTKLKAKPLVGNGTSSPYDVT